ncbi:TrbC/VirB2 family protein [Burkholderia pseudomallei]|uniref:TrbC/VirB2 family protein n=1 Tax=Burkholderia pseudomallei TaxID=28450 RepID=UPI000F04CCED|nr:TrbC/VirB2 family protein [Burkholderia pseudomallei]CAJ3267194.1 Type IV secretion system protein VirB2 [Burkholderia pseudomallei]CAJ5189193.1 Type IV secretion system protein VirB2 [Burkholderia pseudomallei]CAJ5784210.1 Type IV secretion system protein VirB2 [Burkholderia pseudomallei]CAJ6336285.1 Type IV secretion system protein VirB2 [Burkholderia pseudomallei]CAJ6593670.1 Type IV secretion system protein VirB2 [Burkholderia pseudomallei]
MEKHKTPNEGTVSSSSGSDKLDMALNVTMNVIVAAFVLLPELAHAQEASGTFGGITSFLKSITQLLIYEWGYYIGIVTLAIQGYRWKTGRIDLMQLGGWGLGISLVFFAPNIVSDLKARSAGSIQ